MGLSVAFVQSWNLCLYQIGAVLVRTLCDWKVLEMIGNIGIIGIVVGADRHPVVVSQHIHLHEALVGLECEPAQTFA